MYFNLLLSLIGFILIVLYYFVYYRLKSKTLTTTKKIYQSIISFSNASDEIISLKSLFSSINMIKFAKLRFIRIANSYYKNNFKFLRRTLLNNMFTTSISSVISMSIFFIGGLLIINKVISIGYLIVVSSIIGPFSIICNNLIESFIRLSQANLKFNSTYKYYNENKNNKDPKSKLRGLDLKIRANNLSYTYETSNFILDIPNVEFHTNQRYAIVGESGSGKSTFIKLLSKELIPNSGSIDEYFNNRICSNCSDSVKTILISQDAVFMNESLKDNLTLFSKEFSDFSIYEACDISCISDFVNNLPCGLDYRIENYGENLSSGQRQRLSLARGLLHNADIYCFDEFTSNIDIEKTNKIFDAIFTGYLDKKIIVAITHDYNLLKYFDKIIFLKSGKILKIGDLNQLLKIKEFVQLFNIQQ